MHNYLIIFLVTIGFMSCQNPSSSSVQGEKFDAFYEQFHTDSLFQVERILFPLPGLTSYLTPSGTQPKFWYADEWVMHKNLPLEGTGYEQRTLNIGDTLMVDIHFDEKKQGVQRNFSLREGEWKLTFYADYNPIDSAFLK